MRVGEVFRTVAGDRDFRCRDGERDALLIRDGEVLRGCYGDPAAYIEGGAAHCEGDIGIGGHGTAVKRDDFLCLDLFETDLHRRFGTEGIGHDPQGDGAGGGACERDYAGSELAEGTVVADGCLAVGLVGHAADDNRSVECDPGFDAVQGDGGAGDAEGDGGIAVRVGAVPDLQQGAGFAQGHGE